MSRKINIAVFCASSENIDEAYKDMAKRLGALAAESGWRIVYGGAHIGLMGRVADTALNGGGEVIGYIPEHMKAKEIAHEGLTELHITQTMHERQMGMAEKADGFVVLPGGLGTLAEFFEVLTWKQINLHQKPIVLININGYWDHLLALIEKSAAEGFVRDKDRKLFRVFADLEDLPAYFASEVRQKL